jgi:hypothetical protein
MREMRTAFARCVRRSRFEPILVHIIGAVSKFLKVSHDVESRSGGRAFRAACGDAD